jgi:hypothetical protein
MRALQTFGRVVNILRKRAPMGPATCGTQIKGELPRFSRELAGILVSG